MSRLPGEGFILDGESIGDVYHAFDLLEHDGKNLRSLPLRCRLKALEVLLAEEARGEVQLVRTILGADQKQAFLSELRERKAEGAVFKRLDAAYVSGRPASGGSQLKLKFTVSASCLVARANVGKRSVALALRDGKKLVPVGNVTIPGKQAIPAKGDIVEVRYLYAFPGGSLYQPVYLGRRDDITPASCTVTQLKFKPTDAPQTSEEDSEN